ncbi:armadillo repeat-containing protein 6 [Apis mellifera caucasica]|uniref:Armadillo repeat-containing protein 6 homolog n=1 Tax=Apis mellifera TaxID=7460 RepID=A0A7M7R6A8_APIME|nr:armadillo repeat-containing protein 6 homolog [Apis mellifera]KAG6799120.1 armadillo repeat-containing protein 6 [Apis mellifera caucasica]KAG9437981.1 armadillo repeat-containing protein 6 [Apis mellifera carnica]|eukprot:XP_392120.2 armadillo repeat-containing protein 6 homolog [Apis mellifera]
MVRVISQETYDEVVHENMEQFSMTPEEAIEDAVKQLEAQGIDLSNIIKDLILNDDNELITSCLNQINIAIEDQNYGNIHHTLDKLRIQLDKDIARRVYAGRNGAYNSLIKLMKACLNNGTVIKAALKTITSLMTGNPDLLNDEGIALQIQILDNYPDIPTLQCLLRWIRECCIKHENNRQNIFNADIFNKLKKILIRDNASGPELRDACAVIRALVLDDDIRHEYGKAHEHASIIAKGALNVLTGLMPRYKKDKGVVGDLMITLAALIVRNEFCQEVEDAGGLKFVIDVMIDYPDSEKLNWQALKLLKALAGNDNVKSHIVTSGCGPLIVSVISRLKESECVVTAGLACISALTLRCPSNAGVFYDCGAPLIIIDAMKAYSKSVNVLKQAAWAIRNMSVRNKAECSEFITHGVEDVLTSALQQHGSKLESDIKAALRDLGLKVELKEEWTGKGTSLNNGIN